MPDEYLKYSHQAMNTRFALFIDFEDAGYASQAAAAAFSAVNLLEQLLSRFIANSDISRINQARIDEPVRISLETLDCIERSLKLSRLTEGAFDITAAAGERHLTPWEALEIDHQAVSIIKREHISIDLGGIGKGFAVDTMAGILLEWEISRALIHGGSSTALALKCPKDEKGWPVTISAPEKDRHHLPKVPRTLREVMALHPSGCASDRQIIKTFSLINRALSGSGLEKGRHIINPLSGKPAEKHKAAWALAADGTSADALSTAFMILRPEIIERICRKHRVNAILIDNTGKRYDFRN